MNEKPFLLRGVIKNGSERKLSLIQKKVPLIDCKKIDESYDLDNDSDLRKLNFNPNSNLKIADRYVHYENCKHAIVEFKGSTLRKAIEQLQSTAQQLIKISKKIDFVIIVADGLNRFEKQKFKRRATDYTLLDPITKLPLQIRVNSMGLPIRLFYPIEANKTYDGMVKYLSG